MKKIVLNKIKNIVNLEFGIPTQGVKLLTGTNGIGKTTLLTALARIGIGTALRDNFNKINSSNGEIIDPYLHSKLSYHVNNESVTYSKSAKNRWMPDKLENAKVLSKFGYNSVLYIKADSFRLKPVNKDIYHNKVSAVDATLVSAICEVLENIKFSNMKGIKLDAGRAVYLVPNETGYYPEYYFSTGESCVINILTSVLKASRGSLILIDEVDITLYPAVQLKLLRYLRKIAAQLDHTIIISTHSINMIKDTDIQDIYFLHSPAMDGNIKVENPCYHTFALRGIATADDIDLDNVFFVEDDEAKILLDEAIKAFKELVNKNAVYRILPIGGWPNILIFLKNNIGILKQTTRIDVFFDKDVETSINDLRKKRDKELSEIEKIAVLDKYKNNIKYLPITPESGVVKHFESNYLEISAVLSLTIDISNLFRTPNYISYTNDRQGDKKRFSDIIEKITQNTGKDKIEVKKVLYSDYVKKNINSSTLHQMFGPILKY
ncbi:AAA family ATPase [Paenibacillus alginolyticus]|uniref:AAA family ATPase n=1 Tax=Paenibacillus alginolyticus TaxID=59839 RepID=UPI00040AC20B|nr:AAA family ATPase [Paenibacillus alginolyticus]MCY9669577.1 AAA family ATPase [Paenibacillus alginolyticus]